MPRSLTHLGHGAVIGAVDRKIGSRYRVVAPCRENPQHRCGRRRASGIWPAVAGPVDHAVCSRLTVRQNSHYEYDDHRHKADEEQFNHFRPP